LHFFAGASRDSTNSNDLGRFGDVFFSEEDQEGGGGSNSETGEVSDLEYEEDKEDIFVCVLY
jgi:hypothetical protein